MRMDVADSFQKALAACTTIARRVCSCHICTTLQTLSLVNLAEGSLIQGKQPIHNEEENDKGPNLAARSGELLGRGA